MPAAGKDHPLFIPRVCPTLVSMHTLTWVSDATLLAESTQECRGTDGAFAPSKNSSWLGCQLSEKKALKSLFLCNQDGGQRQ